MVWIICNIQAIFTKYTKKYEIQQNTILYSNFQIKPFLFQFMGHGIHTQSHKMIIQCQLVQIENTK